MPKKHIMHIANHFCACQSLRSYVGLVNLGCMPWKVYLTTLLFSNDANITRLYPSFHLGSTHPAYAKSLTPAKPGLGKHMDVPSVGTWEMLGNSVPLDSIVTVVTPRWGFKAQHGYLVGQQHGLISSRFLIPCY